MNTMLMLIGLMTASANNSILSQVQHDFADNEGIRIHYAVMGDGPSAATNGSTSTTGRHPGRTIFE